MKQQVLQLDSNQIGPMGIATLAEAFAAGAFPLLAELHLRYAPTLNHSYRRIGLTYPTTPWNRKQQQPAAGRGGLRPCGCAAGGARAGGAHAAGQRHRGRRGGGVDRGTSLLRSIEECAAMISHDHIQNRPWHVWPGPGCGCWSSRATTCGGPIPSRGSWPRSRRGAARVLGACRC